VTAAAWVVASAVVLVGAVVHGSVGFGINLVAAPFLVALDPAFIPGPLLLVAGLMIVLLLATERTAVDVPAVRSVTVGVLPGAVAGAVALRALTPRGVSLTVAVGVVLAVLATVVRPSISRTRTTLVSAGALSGFAATTVALAGPPIAVLYQHERPAVLRGTLSGVFLIGSPITIGVLAAFGRFDLGDLGLGLALVPATLVGFAVARTLGPVIDRHLTARTVIWLSLLGCAVVVAQAL
jgi:uncharacterized protein